MNEGNQNKPATIRGVLTEIRSIPTQSGTAFVVCKVGEHKCKLFGDLAKFILANQDQYEGQQTEARGHWDVQRGNEFVIDGFGTQPVGPTTAVRRRPVSDTRPEKPAMEVKEQLCCHYNSSRRDARTVRQSCWCRQGSCPRSRDAG